jgi:MFS transporter, DHA1 family, multidrug resistance protein
VTGLLMFSVLLLADALLGPMLWVTLALLWGAVGSLGMVMANATTLAIGAANGVGGTASAMLGALQFGLGAVVSPLVGIGGSGTMLPMAVVMVACAVIAVAATALAPGGRTVRG